jgi:hypothetical protein
MTMYAPALMFVSGMRHLVRLPGLSVSDQLLKLTATLVVLRISIQSGLAPSSSTSPRVLLAMNSEMTTGLAAWVVAVRTAVKRHATRAEYSDFMK